MAAWMILSCSEMLQLLTLSRPNKWSIFLSHHFEYDQFTAPLMLGRTALLQAGFRGSPARGREVAE
jgi:hypothetical protein